MRVRFWFVLSAMAALWALAGCAVIAPTPTPTPAPTNTPTPAPTATNTPRPLPAASPTASLPPAVAFALNKTQNAKSLRYEFETNISVTQDGKNQVIPGLSLSGVDGTLNRHVTISGTTSDTNEFITYEVIVVGDRVFLKGLTGQQGVDPAVWYELPTEAQAGVRRLPSARGLLASFNPDDFAHAGFTAAGSETLDGEQCSVWTAKSQPFILNLVGVTQGSDLSKQVGTIDSTELKLWTCGDGYIHLMTGTVQGHSPTNAKNTAAVNLRFALADMDQALEVKVPDAFKPFPVQAARPTQAPATTGPAETPGAGGTETPGTPAPEAPTETPTP